MEGSCSVTRMICEDKSGTVAPQVFLDVRYWSGLLLEQFVKMLCWIDKNLVAHWKSLFIVHALVSFCFQIKDYCLASFAYAGNVLSWVFRKIRLLRIACYVCHGVNSLVSALFRCDFICVVVSNYCISTSSRNRACLYKVLVSNSFFKVLPKVGMNGSHFLQLMDVMNKGKRKTT